MEGGGIGGVLVRWGVVWGYVWFDDLVYFGGLGFFLVVGGVLGVGGLCMILLVRVWVFF